MFEKITDFIASIFKGCFSRKTIEEKEKEQRLKRKKEEEKQRLKIRPLEFETSYHFKVIFSEPVENEEHCSSKERKFFCDVGTDFLSECRFLCKRYDSKIEKILLILDFKMSNETFKSISEISYNHKTEKVVCDNTLFSYDIKRGEMSFEIKEKEIKEGNFEIEILYRIGKKKKKQKYEVFNGSLSDLIK